MIQMLWRLRRLAAAALFLWLLVLGAQRDAWHWVIWPLITAAAFLVFAEFIQANYPTFGRLLVAKTVALLFVYGLVFSGLPWLQQHFPQTFGALQLQKIDIDNRTADWIEPCLVSVQTAVRRYTHDIERTEASNIEFELTRLHERSMAGGPSPDAAREEAIRERIRRLARNRQEWRAILDICNETPVQEYTATTAAPSVERTPPQTASPAAANGGAARSVVPSAPATQPVAYLTGPAPSGSILAINPSTDAMVAAELSRTLKTELGSFTKAFFSDGTFDRLLDGDGTALRMLTGAPNLVLFACRSSITADKGHDLNIDLRRADVRLTCRRFDARTGTHYVVDSTGTGTGFNDQQARRMGIERAANALGEQLLKR